MPATTRHQPSQ
jgi:hypothetical protein